MVEIKSLPLNDINLGERLREIEEDHAQAIAASISEVGLLSPITVRATPASKGGKFTLVTGAHRFRAHQILDAEHIDVILVKADSAEAQVLEITENLFRNELSVIDRAVFVQKLRELWEDRNGAIKSGRPENNGVNFTLLSAGGFSSHVADRLGISKESAKLIDRLARHLHPELKSALRGTPVADNQSALLKLAKLEPAMQRRAAIGWRETGDIKQVFRLLQNKAAPELSADEQTFSKLADLWARANDEIKRRFWLHINTDIDSDEDAA